MTRGPAPKPTNVKKLEGNPGQRRLNDEEPVPDSSDDLLNPPAWMDDFAKEEWRRLVPMLKRIGILTDADVGVMTAYCQAFSQFRQATETVNKDGLVYKPNEGSNYLQQTPHLSIANKAAERMRKLAAELGITPSSRSRIRAKPPGKGSGKKTGMRKFL